MISEYSHNNSTKDGVTGIERVASLGKFTPELRQSNQVKLNVASKNLAVSSSKADSQPQLNSENPLYQKSMQLVINQNRKGSNRNSPTRVND